VHRPHWIGVLRLTALLAGTSLALSRIGLILHELGGHGGMALALGGTVTGAHLFWFAGGWIRYDVPALTPARDVAIALGGIAIETLLGLALWLGLGVRGGQHARIGRRILGTLGAALLVHAMFYLATGTWHGYGDGRAIHELAGGARIPIAVAAGLAACAAGFAAARHLFGALIQAVPGRGLAGTLAAIAVAAAVNVALDVGELRLRRDATYAVTMQPEGERLAARELARWQRAQPGPVSDAERRARERELARRHRDFPFVWLLAAALGGAIVAGAVRSPRPLRGAPPDAGDVPVPRRLVAIACAAAVISTAAVIAIDAAFNYTW
jgi:hypothetical protein